MPPPIPPREELSRLAARLVTLGAIPIAVFCAVFALARAALGVGQQAQMWTLDAGAGRRGRSVFVLARRDRPGAGRGRAGDPRRRSGTPRAGREARTCRSSTRLSRSSSTRCWRSPPTTRPRSSGCRSAWTPRASRSSSSPTHDALTGLANRKTLEERMESALASAKSQGGTHALVYLDIDFLQRINDSFGHLAGDELLRRLVPVLQAMPARGRAPRAHRRRRVRGAHRELQRGLRAAGGGYASAMPCSPGSSSGARRPSRWA